MSGAQDNQNGQQQGAVVNPQRPIGIPNPVELGYWHIRGLAAPIRMVLVINGVAFENITYSQVMEGEKASTKSWDDAKKALQERHPLANLPYLRAGDVFLVQSMAILAYLGECFNMLGSTPVERGQCNMILNQAMDWRNASVRLWYAPADRYQASRKSYLERGLNNEVGKLARYLEQSRRPYFAGNNPTVCDFPVWELIDQHENFEPGCIFNAFPILREFYQRFASQPGVRYFLQSNVYRLPINNITANWASQTLAIPAHLAQLQGRA